MKSKRELLEENKSLKREIHRLNNIIHKLNKQLDHVVLSDDIPIERLEMDYALKMILMRAGYKSLKQICNTEAYILVNHRDLGSHRIILLINMLDKYARDDEHYYQLKEDLLLLKNKPYRFKQQLLDQNFRSKHWHE